MVQTVTKYLDDLDIQNPLFILSQLDSRFPSHGQRGHSHPFTGGKNACIQGLHGDYIVIF